MPPEDCIKIDGVICAPYDTCQGVSDHSQLQIEDGKIVYVGKATVNAVAGWGGQPEVKRDIYRLQFNGRLGRVCSVAITYTTGIDTWNGESVGLAGEKLKFLRNF